MKHAYYPTIQGLRQESCVFEVSLSYKETMSQKNKIRNFNLFIYLFILFIFKDSSQVWWPPLPWLAQPG